MTTEPPDSLEALLPCSLRAAFRQFVLNDPEVIALAAAVRPNHTAVFDEGQCPGPFVDYKWGLDLTADELAYDFVRSPITFANVALPKPSESIRRVSAVIVERRNRLRDRLVAGEVVARGTFSMTGVVQDIDPQQWARRGLLLDVQSGDLFEKDNHKPVILWSGISLFHVKPLTSVPVPSNTMDLQKPASLENPGSTGPRKTAQQESIDAAVSALWPTGIPKGLLKKSRDQAIINWQKENKMSVCSSKTISRYLGRK